MSRRLIAADGPVSTELVCIWCGAPLDHAELVGDDRLRCGCEVLYSVELVRDADPAEWAKVVAREGYSVMRDGSQVVVTKLVVKL